MKPFEMEVKDTFFFKDGTITFTGPVQTEENFIGPCDCEIVEGGEVKASIWIDGEMIPSTPLDKRPSERAISTRAPIDLFAIGVGRSGFKIRPKI